jgi:hypothetical protein
MSSGIMASHKLSIDTTLKTPISFRWTVPLSPKWSENFKCTSSYGKAFLYNIFFKIPGSYFREF